MTATMTNISARYASTQQHDIHRCEQGLAPILGASCACGGALYGAKRGDGPAFFASLPETDAHSFRPLPSHEARLKPSKRAAVGQPFPTASIPSSASASKERVKQ